MYVSISISISIYICIYMYIYFHHNRTVAHFYIYRIILFKLRLLFTFLCHCNLYSKDYKKFFSRKMKRNLGNKKLYLSFQKYLEASAGFQIRTCKVCQN